MSNVLTANAGRTIGSAQPYPWPYHGSLQAKKSALVACLDVRWRAPRAQSDESDKRLISLAQAMRAAGALIVAVTATPPRVGGRSVLGSGSAEQASPIEADVELAAAATSAFYGSPLDDVLRVGGRADLVLAGWGLEGPVHSTLRAANDRGYECVLVPDACTPIDPDLSFASSEMVRFSGGIFGAFADTASVVEAFDDAQAPPRGGAHNE